MRAQTLAHPGWRGNGIAAQAWWKHASFVRFGADTTFADAARELDAMAEAGVDSMILPDLKPTADSPLPFSERFGTEDDLDLLLREASARRMHVLIAMPVTRLSVGGGEVRFWMTRGIAGFDAGNVSTGDLSVLRGVRSAMARFPGERILMAHVTTSPISSLDTKRDPITLHTVASDAAVSDKVHSPSWQAAEVSAWNNTASTSAGHTALIFDWRLLQQDGGAAKAHVMLNQRASIARRSRSR